MITIKAVGMMSHNGDELGETETTIKGNEYVQEIVCIPSAYKELLEREIKSGANMIIPCYKPKANSMKQAFATLRKYYDPKNITVYGDFVDDSEDEQEEGDAY